MFGGQSKSTAPRLLKFEPPKDPIELEKAKREWEMPHFEKLAYIEDKFRQKQLAIDNNGAMRPEDKLAVKNAMQVYLQQMQLEHWDSEANECYIKEFRDFLQGKSKYNTEQYKHLVPWTNHALVGRDIDAYIDAVLDKKIEFDSKIAKMFNTKMAPRNLQDAWLYFVFIVKQKNPPTDLFLKAWDAFYPYDDTHNGRDNPQSEWEKHPEDAQERADQKGIKGPKESCEEYKLPANLPALPKLPGYDPTPLATPAPARPAEEDVEEHEEREYPNTSDREREEEEESRDKGKERDDEDEEDDDEEVEYFDAEGEEEETELINKHRTTAAENVAKHHPDRPDLVEQSNAVFDSEENILRINREKTLAQRAAEALKRAQFKLQDYFTDATERTGGKAAKLYRKAMSMGYDFALRVTRIQGVDLLDVDSALQMLKEAKKQREASATMLENEKKGRKKDVDLLTEEKDVIESEMDKLRQELKQVNSTLEALMAGPMESRNAEIEHLNSQLEATKKRLKSAIVVRDSLIAARKSLEEKVAFKDDAIRSLEEAKDRLQHAAERTHEQYRNTQKADEAKARELEIREAEIQQLRDRLESLSREKQTSHEQFSELKAILDSATQSLANYDEMLQTAESGRDEAQAIASQLIAAAAEKDKELQEVRSQLERARQENDELRTENQSSREDSEAKARELEAKEREIQESRARLAEELTAVQEKIRNMEESAERVEALQQIRESLRAMPDPFPQLQEQQNVVEQFEQELNNLGDLGGEPEVVIQRVERVEFLFEAIENSDDEEEEEELLRPPRKSQRIANKPLVTYPNQTAPEKRKKKKKESRERIKNKKSGKNKPLGVEREKKK
jgi:hypothetical protein